jgi:hypothetical protein
LRQPNLLTLHDQVFELPVLLGLWPHSSRRQFSFSGVPTYQRVEVVSTLTYLLIALPRCWQYARVSAAGGIEKNSILKEFRHHRVVSSVGSQRS